MNMFLRPKNYLLFIYSLNRCTRFSSFRDFHLTDCVYLRNVSARRRKVAEVQNCESNPSIAGEFSVNAPLKNVNDNFYGIESDEGVIEINCETSLKNKETRRLFKNENQEKIISTSFGTVRYDFENKPKYHGQLERILNNSNLNQNKVHDLNEILPENNHAENCGELSTADILDRNLNSKLTSCSYVDELYFPESNTEEVTSKLEGSSSSSNDNKYNFIEESYFGNETTPEPIFEDANKECHTDKAFRNVRSAEQKQCLHNPEESTESIANHELSSFQSKYDLKSSPSFIDDKSNFIDKSYFIDKVVDSTDKNHPSPVNEKPIKLFADGKQSSFLSDRDVKFNTKNAFKAHETETSIKPVSDLNANIEEAEVGNGEQLSSEWNNPSLEDLESYNKFISNATDLPKKKNNFLFQSKEFLKKSELINAKSSSKVKKLVSFQGNVDDMNVAKVPQSEKEIAKNSQETQNAKVKKESKVEVSNTNEQPETAYDFVQRLRSSKKKLDPELIKGKFIQKNEQFDSKGFRILKNQVPNLSNYTRDEILELLTKNVLYSDDDLIVLNKPYNLVMHESKTVKDPCLSQYLDDLAAELDKKAYKPKLITVHRLDKETCGCLLLARNEISAQRMQSFFSQRKIIKTYWIVTTKVPDPLEGIIDIRISEGSINGRARMVLHPDLPKDIPYQNHSKSGKRAVTHYKVIAESGNAALVEAKPETGIKHQIRVHFGFGLSCPILGDHKYSHLDKLVPQKLQSDMLQRLHVRQSKVRHIPMHIYARSILIPQYRDGRNLFVMAPMPIHMSKNLQRLKFRK